MTRDDNGGNVQLPPGQPGRIAGPSDAKTELGPAVHREAESVAGPAVREEAQMRQIALEEAEKALAPEMAAMLPKASLLQLAEMCGESADAPLDALARQFALSVVDVIWTPPAGCTPSLRGLGEGDVRAKLQLFWRCSIALTIMPLQQLAALSQRKRQFLKENLDAYLPREGATEAAARLAHVRLNLPVFAMVAKLPFEVQNHEAARAPRSSAGDVHASPPKPEPEKEHPQSEKAVQSVQVEEDGEDEPVEPVEGAAGAEAGADAHDKSQSAARHTYDVGYKRWESFDVDQAMHQLDHPPRPEQEARLPEDGKEPTPEDPMEALDRVVAELKEARTAPTSAHVDEGDDAFSPGDVVEVFGLESNAGKLLNGTTGTIVTYVQESGRFAVRFPGGASKEQLVCLKPERLRRKAAPTTKPSELLVDEQASWGQEEGSPVPETLDKMGTEASKADDEPLEQHPRRPSGNNEAVPEASEVRVAGAGGEESTAEALAQEYQKWEHYDDIDDFDDVDGDAFDAGPCDPSGVDLDALTGPKEEVERIRAHWRREATRRARAAQRRRAPQRSVREVLPQAGPVQQRPCEYRPAADPAPKALAREYDKWKTFDADAALLELDNEGTTVEGNATRCSAGPGNAMINTEGYTKDRDEYDLDQDIEKQLGSLKKILAQNAKDAAGFKIEGNALLRDRRPKEAAAAYKRGLATMDLCQHASVIMADSLASKQARLLGDLHRNLAAAQLELGDYEAACESCCRALEGGRGDAAEDEKARYRRALALLRLNRPNEASEDIDKLVSARGKQDAAVQRLLAVAQGG